MDVDIDINAIPEAPGEAPECRICGGGAEPDAPLFYPCKCSGTIRYIHQACLTTWLKHSKKHSCDVCKHPYTFTKVYREDMPPIIPPHVFLKRLVKQLLSTFVAAIRAWLVVFIWLVSIPYATVAWSVYGPPGSGEETFGRPNSTGTVREVYKFFFHPRSTFNFTFFDSFVELLEHPDNADSQQKFRAVFSEWRERVGADIVAGQMATALLVVLFLAIFLLREWVIQNAVPGMFGDEGLGIDGEAAEGGDEQDAAAIPPPNPANVPPVLPNLIAQPDGQNRPPPAQLGDQGRNLVAQVEDLRRELELEGREGFGLITESEEDEDEDEAESGEDDDKVSVRAENGDLPPPFFFKPLVPLDPFINGGQNAWLDRDIPQTKEPLPSDVEVRFADPSAIPPAVGRSEPALESAFQLPVGGPSTAGPSSTSRPSDDETLAPNDMIRLADEYKRLLEQTRTRLGDASLKPMVQRIERLTELKEVAPGFVFQDDPFADQPQDVVAASPFLSRVEQLKENIRATRRATVLDRPDSGVDVEDADRARRLMDEQFKYYFREEPASRQSSSEPSTSARTVSDVPQSSSPSAPSPSHASVPYKLPYDVKGKGKAVEPDQPITSGFAFSFAVDPATAAQVSSQFQQNAMEGPPELFSFRPPSPSAPELQQPGRLKHAKGGVDLLPKRRLPSRALRASPQPGSSADAQETSTSGSSIPTDIPTFSLDTLHPDAQPSTLPPNGNLGGGIPADFTFSFSPKPYAKPNGWTPLDLPSSSSVPSTSASSFSFPNSDLSFFSEVNGPSTNGTSRGEHTPRRPGLPPTTPINELPPFPSSRPGPSSIAIPPQRSSLFENVDTLSPRLATYQAPEQLDPADNQGYFTVLEPESSRATTVDPEGTIVQTDAEEDDPYWDAMGPGAFPRGGIGEQQGLQLVVPIARVPRRIDPLDLPLDLPAPIIIPQEVPQQPAMADDDFDAGVEDEVEGAMEAIGMRGPLAILFQNALLVMCLLYMTMAVGLWGPYTVGKTFALITLRPRQGLQLLNFPIRLVRFVTDPALDRIVILFKKMIVPMGRYLFTSAAQFLCQAKSARSSCDVVRNAWVKSVARFGSKGVPRVNASTVTVALATVRDTLQKMVPSGGSASNQTRIWEKYETVVQSLGLEPVHRQFVDVIGARTKAALLAVAGEWSYLARGDGPKQRAFAVILGYLVLVLGLVFALESPATNARAVRRVAKQQAVVLKVAVFMVIELVLFPLGCGVLLDFNTLPLFESGTLQGRIAFLRYAPFTCVFLHWMLGTMFMYQFAVLLASCRSIMRGGAMWFIKDPGDPNFHPIRYILERPVFAQLRKLGLSAVLYGSVLTFGIGGVLLAMREHAFTLLRTQLLPLRTSMLDALSEIPVDLLILHVVIPVTLAKLKPKRVVLYLLMQWWKKTSKHLRLSAYMFGIRKPEEEQFDPRSPLARVLGFLKWEESPATVFMGDFIRAPATDMLVLPPDEPALIRVNEQGEARTPRGATLKQLQDETCQKAGLSPEQAFTVVYIPPNFRLRILFFLLSFWCWGAMFVTSYLGVPVCVGRFIIYALGMKPVHDAYTWTIGTYVVLTLVILYKEVRRLSRKGCPTPQRVAKKILFKGTQLGYLFFAIGVLLPLLVALVVEFYIILPGRVYLGGLTKPEIHLVETWAIGVLYVKLGWRLSRRNNQNETHMAFQRILANGWRNPDVWAATKDFIAPVCGGLILMLALPPALTWGLSKEIALFQHELAALRYGYPGIFMIAASITCFRSTYAVLQRWMQTIRDAEFLVELRLTNLEKHPAEAETLPPPALPIVAPAPPVVHPHA
ncbi:hypothetical protein FRB99_000996 [Tulasnella sp. 403]|nr:hypothetical protein FRB99_000996 [Tulasnella sp. 403]